MRRVLIMLVGVLLGLASCTPSSTSTDDAGPDREAATSVAPTGDGGDPGLGSLTRVTGTLTSAALTGALDGTAPLPIVLSVASRGGGNGAVVTGVDAPGGNTVVWDGGRPITLSGDGRMQVQPGAFRVGTDGFFADLSGAAHPLDPGDYRISGPVAVGDGSGLATPSTDTPFSAGAGATLSGTGQVEGRLPAGTWLLLGPGAVDLRGALRSQTADGTTEVPAISMADGSFEVTLTVTEDGAVTVDALLDGDVT